MLVELGAAQMLSLIHIYYSYEVFLFQMLVFSLISEKRFFFIENEVFRNIVYVLTTIVFSIVPVLVYKEYIKKLYVR